MEKFEEGYEVNKNVVESALNQNANIFGKSNFSNINRSNFIGHSDSYFEDM